MPTASPVRTLGANLRAAREARGWSRETLKERSGTSVQSIVETELNGRLPRLSTLYAWANALDIHPCDLLP